MKTLLIVESERDLEQVRKTVQGMDLSHRRVVVIHLHSGDRLPALKPGVENRTETDYSAEVDWNKITQDSLNDVRRWLSHPGLGKYLRAGDLDGVPAVEHSFIRAVYTIYKFRELIRTILRRESPGEIILFKDSVPGPCRDLRITESDRIAGPLIESLAKTVLPNAPPLIQSIENGFEKSEASRPQTLFIKISDLVRILCRGIRRTLNVVGNPPRPGRRVLFLGAPRLVFPLMECLPKKNCCLHYLQTRTSPKLLSWFRRNRVIYHTLEDFPVKKTGERESQPRDEKFKEFLRKHGLFHSEGLELSRLLEAQFRFLFDALLPDMATWADQLKRLFSEQAIDLIVVDEDISHFNRALLLLAQTMGIPTLEYQHGAITTYYHQRDVVTRKLVWGRFFKEKLLAETSFPSDRVDVTGAVHLKGLASMVLKRPRDVAFARRRFRIPENKPIFLFTPHNFKKGSRGGLHHIHLDRTEAEEMIEALRTSLNEISSVHLIIKLHHGDQGEGFYRRMLERPQDRKFSYSLVRDVSIYRLINACDVLVTPVSTAILEAFLLNRPIILMDFGKRRQIFPYAAWGAVKTAFDVETFHQMIRVCAKDPLSLLSETVDGREKMIRELLGGRESLDGRDFMRILRETATVGQTDSASRTEEQKLGESREVETTIPY